MLRTEMSDLTKAVDALPSLYKGPGGAVALVKDGAVVVRHAWGFADAERRVPVSPRTPMPICSITKEFTCALLLDAIGAPAQLDGAVAAWLPALEGPKPRTVDLCNNQSGLRDYWALTVLCGAAPEGEFRPEDAKSLIGRTRSLHFAPGTQYSYSNGNFRILADVIESRLGRSLGELLESRLLGPARMETATFCAETADLPGGALGYEGDASFGFCPAVNRIHWTGDAGIMASLDDMIAWELFVDATRDDADGLYGRISTPQTFSDGRPARYGFGLAHIQHCGLAITGHGGALRGWRSQRLHVASERLSVVVMFNHSADANAAALHVLSAALGKQGPVGSGPAVDRSWTRTYHDAGTDLILDIAATLDGRLAARFATGAEVMTLAENGVAQAPGMSLRRDGNALVMARQGDNLDARLEPISGPAALDVEGVFHCAELDSNFTCLMAGGAAYGAFDGFLGQSAMQPLYPVAADVWRLPCQRAMDAPAPGDWTVHFRRDGSGAVSGATVGCWLARHVHFRR